MVWAVEADEQLMAVEFPRHFQCPQCHPGELTAHAGSGDGHGACVGAVVPQVSKDVGKQVSVVFEDSSPVAKVHQDRGKSAVANGIQEHRHVGHHGVVIGITAVKLGPAEITLLVWRRIRTEAEVNSFDEHERTAQRHVLIAWIHIDIGAHSTRWKCDMV